MPDCHPAPFGTNLLLAPTTQLSSDQLSTFSATTTDQSSPPYSGHDPQYSTPESHYNDRESPSSDQLNLDANPSDFSPDVATSSDRDESPDTESTSSGGGHDGVDLKPVDDTLDIQKEILRLSSFTPDTTESKPAPPLNLLAAFNNQLLNTKFGQNFLQEQLAPKPATPTVAQLTSTLPQPTVEPTPTKRKRQRRNPVWPYFDVIDGTAKCKQCLYTTKSVFSTNLKVHLRSHHRSDYEKVIAAEDALNLNALLMSGNASKFLNPDVTRKRIPPMTSSILMTINKLASQQSEDNPLHSVLRQTLAAGTLNQQLLQQQMTQQQKPAQIPLNAANLAALNNLARLNQNNSSATLPNMAGADSLFSQFNFANAVKQEINSAPHGTDANGMPQPKRRRLRRHPVWMFFRDLEDRMVGCINCNFRTGSAFSTNLKMHLKAHHKDDYERVLKLEDDMRMEEGIPNNKIKSELIDYIRGGGNASTPPSLVSVNSTVPKPSPLVQQFISQTMAGRTGQNTPIPKKENLDEDPFNGMSMSDKLAALVGLTPSAGNVEGELAEEKNSNTILNPLEEFKRTFLASNMGLQPPPQEQTIINLNGTILHSDAKSTSSASTDVSGDDKKTERDRALARFWVEQGGNDDLLSNEIFKVLFDSLTDTVATEENSENSGNSGNSTEIEERTPSPGCSSESATTATAGSATAATASTANPVDGNFDISTLTYESLFDALASFEQSLGLTEANACTILIELLRASARSCTEKATVETVAAGLEKIAALEYETDKQERMRKLVSEKMKLKRLFETPEQRAQRLERMRARYRSTKTGEAVSPPISGKREKNGLESETAKEERLRKLREYQRRRLERELPEQRERRLAKMRMNQKLRRERQNQQKQMAAGGIDLLRALAPDYEVPDATHLATLVDEDQLNLGLN